ncbi:MAG: hypothetical protein A3F09_02205 [Chlamydiae bacterium RIFCSPHIGHO2_12_FULL_49_11]|nr:MAG: hypothetical protein A3F09_02205 [Chlamydiae bacterium RIFCSPHIGHO2_12_FULL_49_11]
MDPVTKATTDIVSVLSALKAEKSGDFDVLRRLRITGVGTDLENTAQQLKKVENFMRDMLRERGLPILLRLDNCRKLRTVRIQYSSSTDMSVNQIVTAFFCTAKKTMWGKKVSERQPDHSQTSTPIDPRSLGSMKAGAVCVLMHDGWKVPYRIAYYLRSIARSDFSWEGYPTAVRQFNHETTIIHEIEQARLQNPEKFHNIINTFLVECSPEKWVQGRDSNPGPAQCMKMSLIQERAECDMAHHVLTLDQRELLRAFPAACYQMLSAVADLHEIGLIHFDVKTDNFVMVDGTVKLTDFGGTRHKSDLATQEAQFDLPLTPIYLPPEFAHVFLLSHNVAKRFADEKLDAWALGCALYEWLAPTHGVPWFNECTNAPDVFQAVSTIDFDLRLKEMSQVLDTVLTSSLPDQRIKELIMSLLNPTWKDRLTPREALIIFSDIFPKEVVREHNIPS